MILNTTLPALLISTALLIAAEVLYIFTARRYKIGAKVTERSSHKVYTPTGGGIIFPLAAMLFFIFCPVESLPQVRYSVAALSILTVVSFADDIHALSPLLRLSVQVFVVSLTFGAYFHLETLDIFLLAVIFCVGFVNAYNFMDGINGMLASYSLVTLLSLLYVFAHQMPTYFDGCATLSLYLLISVIIFASANFCNSAKVFCGDVGSITMGFIIAFLFASLILFTGNAAYLIMLIVYGADTVFTIFQRLFAGENIFESHRKHLYQLLANQEGMPHLRVSVIYAATQLAINVGFLCVPRFFEWSYVIIVTSLITIIYFVVKRAINRKNRHLQ